MIARAEMRLAEEYDAAQERGEVAGHDRSKVEPDNVATAAGLGLRRDEILEARRLHDAELAKEVARNASYAPARVRLQRNRKEPMVSDLPVANYLRAAGVTNLQLPSSSHKLAASLAA